ncbi:MAG: NAD-dependent epimerase/dehydratase family protein [Myxococcota bacterium]
MKLTRRSFSLAAFAASAAACGPTKGAGEATVAPEPQAPQAKRLLILGGTGFLGPHVVEAAIERGYGVTLFNRGQTNPHLFPDLEKLRGDRNVDVSALEGREFEIVIDTSGYFPRQVEATLAALGTGAGRYLFVSSISAFADLSKPGLSETAASAPMPDPYSEAMPQDGIVVRPGLIVGPGDPTDRFTYWPTRIAKGGVVLAPNDPADPVQFIDVRDLAAFMLSAAENGEHGIFNAAGPGAPTTIGALLEACKEVSGSDAEFVWAPTPFLAEHEVAPWMQLTVWVPSDDPEFGGMGQVDIAKAKAAGLSFRPAKETIRDTLAWWEGLPADRRAEPRAGLAAEKERAVLAALQAAVAKPAA